MSLHPSSHAQHQDLPLALPCHIVKPCARQKGKAENEGETRKTTRKGNTSDVRPQKKKRKKEHQMRRIRIQPPNPSLAVSNQLAPGARQGKLTKQHPINKPNQTKQATHPLTKKENAYTSTHTHTTHAQAHAKGRAEENDSCLLMPD